MIYDDGVCDDDAYDGDVCGDGDEGGAYDGDVCGDAYDGDESYDDACGDGVCDVYNVCDDEDCDGNDGGGYSVYLGVSLQLL